MYLQENIQQELSRWSARKTDKTVQLHVLKLRSKQTSSWEIQLEARIMSVVFTIQYFCLVPLMQFHLWKGNTVNKIDKIECSELTAITRG